jgi:hypothetical protein
LRVYLVEYIYVGPYNVHTSSLKTIFKGFKGQFYVGLQAHLKK